jgi:phosphoenolpyruvate-protein phosphotransferase/dihydroxyacetone kinase phosphotransfer subunit
LVGLVVVSHSAPLAEGVVTLASEMDPAHTVAIAAAGGVHEGDALVLGTDAERIREAIAAVMTDDGVLVLMDLGSALMSAELAIELLGEGGDRVRLSGAPLVEGAVAAVAAAAGGAGLDEVAAAADAALEMKAAQLGDEGCSEATGAAVAPPAPADPDALTTTLALAIPSGLHARPAARFVAALRDLDAAVTVTADAGRPADGRSLTGLIGLGARQGERLAVAATGNDAAEAITALEQLAAEGFGEGAGVAVTGAPQSPAGPGSATPSPTEARNGGFSPATQGNPPHPGTTLSGIPSAGGVVLGPARHLGRSGELVAPPDTTAQAPDRERARLHDALAVAAEAIRHDRATIAAHAAEDEAAIFDAHLALLADDALLAPARAAIDAGATAQRGWYDAVRVAADRLGGLESQLLRERAADVTDAGQRVLRVLSGEESAVTATPAGIVIAGELTAAEAAALDPATTTGVAAAGGAPTAHGAILARALGLPTVLGLGPRLLAVPEGAALLLDGEAGTVTVAPDPELARVARGRAAAIAQWRAGAQRHAAEPGALADGPLGAGPRIEILANLGSVQEAGEAVTLGAEGVGLLRTEFLYMARDTLPDEDEQVQALRAIAVALGGRPLVVRTLDAGADKPMRALQLGPQANPFLGVRGIRVAREHPELLERQLRAILRVAAEHPLRVMLPMVSITEEVLSARAALARAREATGIDAELPLGIMVEVPAAAVTADRLAEHVDFFSIGTNDLTQYVMAAERGNARVASLLDGFQPAVFRLVSETVRAAAAHDVPVAVCGELAGDPGAAIILAGLGVRELSMSPRRIAEVKAALRTVGLKDARAAAHLAIDAADAAEVHGVGANLLAEAVAAGAADAGGAR